MFVWHWTTVNRIVRKRPATKACRLEVLSDHQLIEATKQGDEAAFAEIVSRYRNPLTNFLYRMLNDYEEAVDLAQETFVRVYFAIERYHTDYAFSTYIYRIASNLAISEIRKRKRRKLMSLTGFFSYEGEEVDFHPPDKKPLADIDLLESGRKNGHRAGDCDIAGQIPRTDRFARHRRQNLRRDRGNFRTRIRHDQIAHQPCAWSFERKIKALF